MKFFKIIELFINIKKYFLENNAKFIKIYKNLLDYCLMFLFFQNFSEIPANAQRHFTSKPNYGTIRKLLIIYKNLFKFLESCGLFINIYTLENNRKLLDFVDNNCE